MNSLLLCLCVLVAVVSAHDLGLGRCPKPAPVEKYNEKEFLSVGTWYVLYKLKSGSRCLADAIYRDKKGELVWREQSLNLVAKQSTILNITSPMHPKTTSGRYKITYGAWPDAELTVMGTDYSSWALVYQCQQAPWKVAHRKSASILVTKKNYGETKEEKEQLKQIWSMLKESEADIDIDDMDAIDHKNCTSPKDADFVFTVNGVNLSVGGVKGQKAIDTASGVAGIAKDAVKNLAGKAAAAADDALNTEQNDDENELF